MTRDQKTRISRLLPYYLHSSFLVLNAVGGNKKAHPHPLHTYIRAVGKQALTRYTRKGYAYIGVSQSQEVVFQTSFADYLDVNLIRISILNSLPAMSCKAAYYAIC